MIETATELSQKLNADISDIREKQRNVACQKRKLIEKSLGAIPSKQPRLSASLTKPASKKKKKFYWQKENHNSVSLVGKEVTVKNIELCLCVLLCHIL